MSFITRQGRALLLTAVLVVESVCVSNGDNPANLVGQWVSIKDGQNVELFKDGTGAVGDGNITWKTEGKRFVLSSGNTSKIGDYNLSGYEFTRTFDDGEVVVWVRKDKVEEYKNKKKKEAEQRVEKMSTYFTDSRNGQKYRSVKIGGKTWMAQNLNYQTGNSWCYGGDNSNCEKYGRLYDWNTAKTACPTGWHLPSQKEWNDLVTASGGNAAGKALKSTYSWNNNGNGTDDYGFSALPGGIRFSTGSFGSFGYGGYWWTATENASSAYRWHMSYDGDDVYKYEYGGDKNDGYSVRCLQD
ncbi:MAG: fibrobacter succinogenes major paralogous domain-containing protein [Chitinispirillales bacterium]|jgi:uncharacterized protein (TIGR02145 family)|nr:fibrobacter succinogenes major paralogous domain-containing protein [Chitinispirillales bacterium]